MPHSTGTLDEETLFLQSIVSTNGREHPLGIGDRDLILKLRPLMVTVAMSSPVIRTRTLRSL
jgi:hypothetical protein